MRAGVENVEQVVDASLGNQASFPLGDLQGARCSEGRRGRRTALWGSHRQRKMMPPEQLLVTELLLTAIDSVSASIAYGTDVIKPEGC